MAFEEHFLFDVFISHSSKDKAIVRALAERLRADGVAVWFDEWLIRPGDSIALAIEKGLERSRVLLLIMSSHAFASEWTTLERHTALFRDPTNEKRRFVPLRIDDSDIVSTLRQFAYVDWRQPSESEYKRLLGACLTIPPEPRPTSGFFSLKKQFTIKKHDFVAMAMSPDGVRAAIGSTNKALSVWSIETGAVLTSLVNADFGTVVTAAKFFDNGKHLVAGSHGGAISIWDETGRLKISGSVGGSVHGLDVDESKQLLAIACGDKAVHLLSLDNLSPVRRLVGHQDRVFFVKFAPRHGKILSGGCDNTVRVWNGASGECTSVLTGHTNFVHEAGFVGDGSTAITCSNDKTLRLWNYDAAYPRELGRLEGHTSAVIEVDVAGDGNFVLSSGADKSLRLWDIQSKSCVGAFVLEADSVGRFIPGKNQAVSAGRDGRLCIWDLPISLAHQVKKSPKELYTNAKVLLVGDSGVGKSGLAIRLTQDRFETTASTDAHWVTQLKLPDARSGDLSQTAVQEREIWLWDFAGQADYRLIHQLFMDETALAVLVFNPQGEHLFEGLSQWDQSLVRSARRKFAKLLVAGRCDRGGLTVGRQPFEEFAAAHNFASFIESSALTGAGCATLRNEIVAKIDWDSIPWTASTQTFKKLKDEILGLRDENVSILRMSELKQRLEFRMPAESFTIDELRAVVGLLAGPGLIVKLEFGDLVVLQPEWINKYAAAVIRSVRSDVGEMGVIDEAQVLAGELVYTTDTRPTHAAAKQAGAELEMQRLEPADEAIILRAMHQMFVDHGICVRNTLAG
jgi:small GTP-binding protein